MTTGRGAEDDAEGLGTAPDAARWLDEHGDALFRYARSRVSSRELAEDLVQDTLVAAIQASGRFGGRSTVRTWLLSILRNKIVDHYRRASEAIPAAGGEPWGEDDAVRGRFFTDGHHWRKALSKWETPPEAVESREFWDVLGSCLDRLPRPLASVFVLRTLEGLGMEEVREALSLNPGLLRVRLHRARLLLRECLERNWFGEDAGGPTRSS
jgi:RNA polymerase sigma-70 factor (ECF subfamily)